MSRGPRGKKHLLVGLLFLLAGAFFITAGLNSGGSGHRSGEILIPNSGEEYEGHTPIGFSGSGIGLFVGDNLNSNFPNRDGLQTFLTFDIEQIGNTKVKSAVLVSQNAHIVGNPFKDLGKLAVFETEYGDFTAKVWNTETKEEVCSVGEIIDGEFICDITEHIERLLREEKTLAQFIMKFEQLSDNDEQSDLLLFYESDSNKNEPGIFNIRVNGEGDFAPALPVDESITIPIVLHRVILSDELSTERSEQNILELFKESERIWNQANIKFDVSILDSKITDDNIDEVQRGNYRALYGETAEDDLSFHVYFMNTLGGPNGIAFPPLVAVVADNTTVPDYRATAHEIGHLLGLEHTKDNKNRLLYQGADGENLAEFEIESAREYAEEFKDEVDSRI